MRGYFLSYFMLIVTFCGMPSKLHDSRPQYGFRVSDNLLKFLDTNFVQRLEQPWIGVSVQYAISLVIFHFRTLCCDWILTMFIDSCLDLVLLVLCFSSHFHQLPRSFYEPLGYKFAKHQKDYIMEALLYLKWPDDPVLNILSWLNFKICDTWESVFWFCVL